MEGSSAPVQGAVLQPFYSSPSFYQDHGAHLVDSTQEGHPPPQYLDDWLLLAESQQKALSSAQTLLQLCARLGVCINMDKSTLQPAQRMVFLGVNILSPHLKAQVDNLLALLGCGPWKKWLPTSTCWSTFYEARQRGCSWTTPQLLLT